MSMKLTDITQPMCIIVSYSVILIVRSRKSMGYNACSDINPILCNAIKSGQYTYAPDGATYAHHFIEHSEL